MSSMSPDSRPQPDAARRTAASPDYEALLHAVVDGAVDSVVMINEEGRIQWCNPATERLFGYSIEELLGRNVTILMPAPYSDEHDQYLANYLRGGPAKIIGIGREVRGLRRDGSTFPLDLAVTESRFLGRRVFTGIMRDLTEKKEAAQRALQTERLAAIGQMITGLAHESRNALQRTLACLELLEMEVADRPTSLELVHRIEKAQGDLQRLFQELRDFARPIRLASETVRLPDTWREAWHLLAAHRTGRDIQFRETFPTDDDQVAKMECRGDPFQLVQVFRNLLENSLAACADPVKIEIQCHRSQRAGRAFWEIHVFDNGPGLTEQQRLRVFEPFFTTKSKGTGLGMPIAYRIVEAHQGTLTVGAGDSGAEFIVTLPCPAELDEQP